MYFAGCLGFYLNKIAINKSIPTMVADYIAKKLKKSSFVEFLFRKAAEAKVPKESDINIEKMQREFIIGIWFNGNQFTTNLLGELSMKQNPNPVIKVPTIKNQ